MYNILYQIFGFLSFSGPSAVPVGPSAYPMVLSTFSFFPSEALDFQSDTARFPIL